MDRVTPAMFDDLALPGVTENIGVPANPLYYGWMRFQDTLDTTTNQADLIGTFSDDIDGNISFLSTTNFGVLGFAHATQLGFVGTDAISGVASQAAATLQLTWRAAGGRETNWCNAMWPAFNSYRPDSAAAGTGQVGSGPGGQYCIPQRFGTPLYVDDGGVFAAQVSTALTLTANNTVTTYILGFCGSDQNWLSRYAACACLPGGNAKVSPPVINYPSVGRGRLAGHPGRSISATRKMPIR